jgi:hypothetical protein
MGVVLVNSMPALHRGGGTGTATPDVCLTPAPPAPPVPTPYCNVADFTQSVAFSTVVKINQMNALTAGTTIPTTSGDESGSSGGVTSGMVKGKASFTTFSPTVLFTGQGAARAGDATQQNGTNAVGVASPSG